MRLDSSLKREPCWSVIFQYMSIVKGEKSLDFALKNGCIFIKKLHKKHQIVTIPHFLGKNRLLFQFSTISSTFPPYLFTTIVEGGGNSPHFSRNFDKNGGKLFTLSTVFSTEKPPRTLDFAGFSPVFDHLFAGGNQRQTALNFSGKIAHKRFQKHNEKRRTKTRRKSTEN